MPIVEWFLYTDPFDFVPLCLLSRSGAALSSFDRRSLEFFRDTAASFVAQLIAASRASFFFNSFSPLISNDVAVMGVHRTANASKDPKTSTPLPGAPHMTALGVAVISYTPSPQIYTFDNICIDTYSCSYIVMSITTFRLHLTSLAGIMRAHHTLLSILADPRCHVMRGSALFTYLEREAVILYTCDGTCGVLVSDEDVIRRLLNAPPSTVFEPVCDKWSIEVQRHLEMENFGVPGLVKDSNAALAQKITSVSKLLAKALRLSGLRSTASLVVGDLVGKVKRHALHRTRILLVCDV